MLGRVIKIIFYLVILTIVGLWGYSFLGDMTPPKEDRILEIKPDDQQ